MAISSYSAVFFFFFFNYTRVFILPANYCDYPTLQTYNSLLLSVCVILTGCNIKPDSVSSMFSAPLRKISPKRWNVLSNLMCTNSAVSSSLHAYKLHMALRLFDIRHMGGSDAVSLSMSSGCPEMKTRRTDCFSQGLHPSQASVGTHTSSDPQA